MDRKAVSWFNILLVLFAIIGISLAWWPREYPRIGLARWLELDEEDRTGGGVWRSDFENLTKGYLSTIDQGSTYVVSSQITGLTIDCNASYPVQWVSHNEEASEFYSFYTTVRYLRTNPDVFNTRSNLFTAQLNLYGEVSIISGNYSCVSSQYPDDVLKNVYIFWAGTNPSNLVLAGKTIEVQSKDGHYLVLPCRVSRPDIHVDLYREVNSEFNLVRSPFIKFNPKIGFTVNMYQYNGVYGRFKCSVSDDEDEALIMNIKKGVRDDIEFNNTMIGSASLSYNKSSQEIICCSNSSKPPKLHTIFCVDQFSCETRRPQLHAILNNGKRYKNGTCTAERVYNKDSGLMRCMGDGIDVTRNFYTDLPIKSNNHSTNLYFSWHDINRENMMEISIASRKPIYAGQNVTVSCDTSFNYFADGMQWAVRWVNQSLKLKFFPVTSPYAHGNGNADFYENSITSFQSIRLQVNKNMSEIICFAPIWNSTDWVNKTFVLDVHDTKIPVFQTPEPEVIQWTLNDTEQIIECRVSGAPSPAIRWKKNNKTILPETNLVFKRQNGTSLLKIHRVSHETQGEYRCIAANFGGSAEKRFLILVEDPSTPLGALGITVLILIVMGLVGGMGFLIWKMQLQKRIIDHLAGIVFRDVDPTVTPTNTNSNNHTNTNNHNDVSTQGNSDQNPFPSSLNNYV